MLGAVLSRLRGSAQGALGSASAAYSSSKLGSSAYYSPLGAAGGAAGLSSNGAGGGAAAHASALGRLWALSSPFICALLALYILLLSPSALLRPRNANGSPARLASGDWTRIEMEQLDPFVCDPAQRVKSYGSARQVCDAAKSTIKPLEEYDLTTNRHFTQDQCDVLFPGLYAEAERAANFWKSKGGVKLHHLDSAMEHPGTARALIINNKLYVSKYHVHQQGTRTRATLNSINEALVSSSEPVPNIEFVIHTGDTGKGGIGAPWVLGRREQEHDLTLMPDYGFYSWPEPGVGTFEEVQDKCQQFESKLSWKDKIPKLFWRGALMVNIRKEFVDIAAGHAWNAVRDIEWGRLKDGDLLTPEQHCQYKYLGHAEGWAYSGRLKYIQQCRAVIVAHEMQYTQHFHHLFNSDPSSPDQNMVIVDGPGFAGLPKAMDELVRDDARAEHIANNSYAFFRYWLSPAATDCYWRRLFKLWADAQAFEPTLHRNATAFGNFNLLMRTSWDPY